MDHILYVIVLQPFITVIIAVVNSIFTELRKNLPSIVTIYNRLRGYTTYTLVLEEYYDKKRDYWSRQHMASKEYIYYVSEYLRLRPPIGDAELLIHNEEIPFKMSPNWFQINNIYFYVSVIIITEKEQNKTRITKILISTRPSGDKSANDILDEFLKMCKQQWHDSLILSKKIIVRDTPIGVKEPEYKTYDFVSKITFDKLYFPEKQTIIDAIDKLNAGELNKLTLLLSGIPGCGKTSVAKAIANLTGRCIIQVNMNYIKTLTDLHDLFFSQRIAGKNIKNNNRIYLLEEIDTLGKLVEKRESTDTNNKHGDGLMHNLACLSAIVNNSNGESKNNISNMFESNENALTLGDMLTTFDGIVELTGAIVILTTNHVEKIDDALIRRGRIQINCVMGKCTAADAAAIIKSHYPEYDPECDSNPIANYQITPADLATFCQISTNLLDARDRIGKFLTTFSQDILTF